MKELLQSIICTADSCLCWLIVLFDVLGITYLVFCHYFKTNRLATIIGWLWIAVMVGVNIIVLCMHACIFTILCTVITIMLVLVAIAFFVPKVKEKQSENNDNNCCAEQVNPATVNMIDERAIADRATIERLEKENREYKERIEREDRESRERDARDANAWRRARRLALAKKREFGAKSRNSVSSTTASNALMSGAVKAGKVAPIPNGYYGYYPPMYQYPSLPINYFPVQASGAPNYAVPPEMQPVGFAPNGNLGEFANMQGFQSQISRGVDENNNAVMMRKQGTSMWVKDETIDAWKGTCPFCGVDMLAKSLDMDYRCPACGTKFRLNPKQDEKA